MTSGIARQERGVVGSQPEPVAKITPHPRILKVHYLISAVLAPTVGAMLGGWIIDSYSWRWIFFITLPAVSLALYLTYTLVEDPPFLRRIQSGGIRVDYIGISMLALGVGSLQILLDKGQEDDWLGSHFITTLAITAAVCLITLVIWEWFRKDPIIDVRLFRSFNNETKTWSTLTPSPWGRAERVPRDLEATRECSAPTTLLICSKKTQPKHKSARVSTLSWDFTRGFWSGRWESNKYNSQNKALLPAFSTQLESNGVNSISLRQSSSRSAVPSSLAL